ncbi:MAG: 4'-phosphopantetheinyl transferase superfamily protein [Kofleriaceae bacterium]
MTAAHGYRVAEPTAGGIAAVLPAGVAAVEAFGAVEPDPLAPGELALVARAVVKRQLEFARGRSCARRAMAVLGAEPVAILTGPAGAPIWPPGLVGSITHCADYCCAALARSDRWASIGIDAEVLQPIEPQIRDLILLASEQRHVDQLDPSVPWAAVMFSAKEAIYKACYPLVGHWIGFHDVEVHLEIDGRFDVEWKIAIALPRSITGRFRLEHGRVLATVVVER